MKTPLKIFIIIICTLLLGHLISVVCDKGFRHYRKSFFEKMDSICSGTEYNDIIFMGNSRTERDIDPYYVDSICKTGSFNVGWSGADINNALILFKIYLQHHRAPKTVVLGYDHSIFRLNDQIAFAGVFLFYLQNAEFKNITEAYGASSRLLKLIPDLKYSFFTDNDRLNILSGWSGKDISEEIKDMKLAKYEYDYRGYLNVKNTGFIINNNTRWDTVTGIRKESEKFISELINLSIQNSFHLVFVYTPEFYGPKDKIPDFVNHEHSIIDSMVISICKKYNIPNQRFDTNEFTPEDFADMQHLNLSGAKKFSIMLGNYLKALNFKP